MTSPVAAFNGEAGRFHSLWRRNLLPGADDSSTAISRTIEQAYAEPQRHYHTMAHIEHCLGMFDLCRHLLDNPDAVELAIWFHDVVYDPGACDNEARSAELYRQLSERAHPPELRDRVDQLIMATVHLDELIDDNDTQFMVDIDLSSFGLPWAEFLRDSLNLRLENPEASDVEHYDKAKKFQRALLARARFYQSDFFYRRLETKARKNLDDYFEYLREQADS